MNSATATAKPHVLAALRKGQAVIHIGDVHGWPRPQAYNDAVNMLYAAREAERTVPTLPTAPDKPTDIKKWIDATVEVRHQEDTRRDVVDELVLTWERETAVAALAAATDVNNRLVTVFDELLEKLDAHADAPRTLTGHESPEEIEAHTSALRVASELAGALTERATIADAAQEAEDIGPDIIWLILAPHGGTTRDQVNDALKTFNASFPQTLAEWDSLRPLGLRLAHIGEVAARRQRHTDFMWRIAHETADLGQRDHAYGEFQDDQPGHSYGLAIEAESNRMFDHSPSISL